MADGYVSQVQLPNNETYDIKDKNAVTEIQIDGSAQTKTNGVVNLPAYPNDTKVTQGDTITTNVRPLILERNDYSLTAGANNNIETGYNSDNVTHQVYRTNNIYASPANGRLYLSSTATPQMYLKYRTLDYTLANNGISSEQWIGYRVVDKNNKVVALFNLDVFPDGKIGAFVRTGNYNSTTSSTVSGYMGVFAHKDGSVSYSISHEDKFREAIEVYSKLETETSIRSYLTSTVGHSCKNLLDITTQTHNSQVVIESIDNKTGSIHISTAGGTNHVGAAWDFSFENGHSYTISFINLLENAHASVTIRRSDTYTVKYSSGALSTLGNKTFTFTFTEEEFPEGAYVSLRCTDGTGVAGAASISQLMLRESIILDDTFEPYQIPTDERVNNVQQTLNNNNKDYPLLFSYAEEDNTTTDITNISYRNNDFFINPSSGYIYSKKGFCAGPFKTAAAGKRVWINQDGITADNYLDGYSIKPYERMIIKAWAGKHTSNTGLLLTVDSGGLTMIGGGESSTNLANLIDNDQTIDNPKKLDINNSQDATGKETTAFTGDSEHLVLSSDGSIYFVTGCQTLANRAAVCLNNARTFYPMTDNSGKIGSSSFRWQYGYFGQVYGTGSAGTWKSARDNASFIKDTDFNGANNYAPIIDLKTTNGDWSMGVLRDAEYLIFSYVMDSTYSGSDNKARKYVLEAPSTSDGNIYHILHTGNLQTYTIPNVTSVGTLPSLVIKDTSFYPVKSTTTTASKIVSKDITIYPVTSSTTTASKVVGKDITFYPVTSSTTTATKVTLGTSISADDITSWDAGTLPSFTVSKGVLTLDSGSLPSLSYTSRSIPNVTGNTNVTVPILSSSVTVKGISTNTDVTVPILSSSVTIKEISTNTDVAVPILSSSVTISGVSTWSAGTLPSLDTAISVVGLSST